LKIKLSSWIYWVKVVVGALLLIIIYKKVNETESVFAVLNDANLFYIILSFLLLIPHVYIAFLKWRYLLRTRFADISTGETLGSLFFGITLGMVTPGNLGELGRGLFFQKRDKMVVTGLTVLDKLSNMLVISTLGLLSICLYILNQPGWQTDGVIASVLAVASILAIIWISIFRRNWIKRILTKISRRYQKNIRLQAFMNALVQIKRKDVLAILGLTLSWFVVITLQYHVLITAFTHVDLGQSFQGVTAAIFTKMLLPISFGGLGIREGVTVFYFSLFDISRAAVFNASLIIFLINFILPAIAGFYYLLQLNGRNRRTKSIPLVSELDVDNIEQAELSSKIEK
jgi:uncharacterized protein (TIRG00374 family)